ncbi:MAG: hypothetical protein DMG05_19950 [Acidobacteria bacterium]|nr:MAG: hypothetical protein DMG05_19950 [Acidobacteriota bacterium]
MSPTASLTNRLTTQWIDNRMIASMRLILAVSALLIIAVFPSQPDRFVAFTYATLFLYAAYSTALYTLVLRRSLFPRSLQPWVHWIDVGWYAVLISLCSGTNWIFSYGFYFPIFVASFWRGFLSGLRVAVVSTVIFTVVGLGTRSTWTDSELDRFLFRAICLLVLGYMIAYWGGFDVRLKRRLTLLKEITSLSNPRFGIDRTIGSLMEHLREFYDAEACLLITPDATTSTYSLRRADRRDAEASTIAEPIAVEPAQLLLLLPGEHAVVYSNELAWRAILGTSYYAYDVTKGKRSVEGKEACEAVAVTLDANSFVTVPLRFRSQSVGRLYLTTRRRYAFNDSDVDFLLQVIDHVMPVIDNIRLVDQLASNAAEEERQRIARDLHDSVIQPYIGLQIGLASIRWKLANQGADVTRDIERLINMTDVSIAELRACMNKLKESGEHEGSLLSAVQRFAGKFSEATGIGVQVAAKTNVRVADRLAAEAFQIVAEGLSNIRRHTHATQATIHLGCHNGHLILGIENDLAPGETPQPFTPHSITERSEALGGRAYVEPKGGYGTGTVVVVEIPL